MKIETEDVLKGWDRVRYHFLLAVHLISHLTFWTWWLSNVGDPVLFTLSSIAMGYLGTVLPTVYFLCVGMMRKPKPIDAPQGLRVAMISLTVPGSEGVEVVKKQLKTLAKVEYPHESWILVDKCHSSDIKDLATSLGVNYFCRHDAAQWGEDQIKIWNQEMPPFKAKTKAGNVNAWLDAFGDDYDFFVQLDIDHLPKPEYLHKTLGFFQDPKIAWVQAPSVYRNWEYWTAKGSSEQEVILQGPLQQGFYGFSGTPFIIGSHCTYRTVAVQEIGGFQPTRAEDHLDTMLLAAKGHQGVYLPEIIAVGDGPENFETYLGQQFAWAFSMIQILFGYTPRMLWKLNFRQKLQFLFAETWYPFWSISTLIMFVLPILALMSDTLVSQATFGDFYTHFSFPVVCSYLCWWWSRKWFQPKGTTLSWRGIVLHVARWPIVLSALIQVILRVKKPYMITPKGVWNQAVKGFSLKPHIPYFMLIGIALSSSWIYVNISGYNQTQGYLLFPILGALTIACVYWTVLFNDIKDLVKNGLSFFRSLILRFGQLNVAALLFLALVLSVFQSKSKVAEAVTFNPSASLITSQSEELPIKDLPLDQVALGAYDPDNGLAKSDLVIKHDFVDWTQTQALYNKLKEDRKLHRVPLISLQPFGTASGDNKKVLSDTVSFRNDAIIIAAARAIQAQSPQVVYLRWGHEMELIDNYPWALADPAPYVAAYRHVWDIFQSEGVNNVKWVWSPAGNFASPPYYPGGQYVDYIGLTVFEYKPWDPNHQSDGASFLDLFGEKYAIMSWFNKPIMIAELGVADKPSYQKEWMKGAFAHFGNYPLLKAVVYFNALNAPNTWKVDRPDWRLNSDLFPSR